MQLNRIKLWTKIENIIQVSSPCGLDDEHLDTQQMNMQLLSLHSYSLRFAMAACRAADAKPDLPRLDYISCKKRKNIAIVALNGLSINDITVGVIRNQLFIEYWPSNR